MVTQQLQDFARQSVYDALSALFLQPEAKGAYENYVEAMRAAAGLAAELGTNAAPFEAVLDAPAPEPLELEREYARLFLGTCEGTVPLAESAWLHRDEIPLSQLECRKAYADAGLETAGILGVPEDHLGLQLGFLTVLILGNDPAAATAFFEAHPAKWLPAFAAAVRARSDVRLYALAAGVLEGVIEIEAALAQKALRRGSPDLPVFIHPSPLFSWQSCGKSTLTGSIADLVKPASGTISVNGRVFRSDDPCIDLPVESRGIGFVFQSHRLFPHLTVRKNLLFGRRLGGRRTAVDQERLIEVLGIAHLLSRRPDTLSGGESQRVALGRAILAAETLLIMDEPLASLDSERKAELLGYFERIPEITGIPVLYITHAADEVERLAKTVLTMKDGRIANIRTPT